jgi:hypothetical protein
MKQSLPSFLKRNISNRIGTWQGYERWKKCKVYFWRFLIFGILTNGQRNSNLPRVFSYVKDFLHMKSSQNFNLKTLKNTSKKC